MAFVPKHRHDLFLSYVREESAWVDSFRRALRDVFLNRMGEQITFWQDTHDIKPGQDFSEEIKEAIRNAAVFLAIVSPRYLASEWCGQEMHTVLENGLEALRVDRFHRFIKIVKTPDANREYAKLVRNLEHIPFFAEGGEEEFSPESDGFRAAILKSFHGLRELLVRMSNGYQLLYVAPGGTELADDRDSLVWELKDKGFAVRRGALLRAGFDEEAIQEAIEPVSAAIFLFAAAPDAYAKDQIRAAQRLKKPVLCWVRPGKAREAAVEGIYALGQLPDGPEILGGNSIRELIPQLFERLRSKKASESPGRARAGVKEVYVNFDKSIADDCRTANLVSGIVEGRSFRVLRDGRDGEHKTHMANADAVLLFRATRPEPDNWLRFSARELAKAEEIYERSDLVRGLLVNDPDRAADFAPLLQRYPWSEPFSSGILNPFFEELGGPAVNVSGNR
jgi:hypothetical protein